MEKTEVQPVTDAEMDAALDISSVFANKFYISVGPGGVRITFAETHPKVDIPNMRLSVTLPHGDAFALRDVLSDLLEKHVKIVDAGEVLPEAAGKAKAAEKPAARGRKQNG